MERLFVLDEVQTGMYRTGRFLASHHFGVDPDMVVLAKALSGGLIPSGAVLMSDEVYEFGLRLARAGHCPYLDLQRKWPGDARRTGHARRAGAGAPGRTGRRLGDYLRERLRDALVRIRNGEGSSRRWAC